MNKMQKILDFDQHIARFWHSQGTTRIQLVTGSTIAGRRVIDEVPSDEETGYEDISGEEADEKWANDLKIVDE